MNRAHACTYVHRSIVPWIYCKYVIDHDDFVKHGMSSLQADRTERVQWIRRASSKILL